MAPIAQHFFVSYARADEDIAKRILARLDEYHLDLWFDQTDITWGSKAWEQVIRDAIENSFGVILIATPAARRSVHVQDECTIARALGRKVYPLWADGQSWQDCAPIGLISSQFVDCRFHSFETGIIRAAQELQDSIASQEIRRLDVGVGEALPRGYIYVRLEFDRAAVFRTKSYASLQALLTEMYFAYLTTRYGPVTYGKDWILVNDDYDLSIPTRAIVPDSWLPQYHASQPVSAYDTTWAMNPLDDYGLISGSRWTIVHDVQEYIKQYGFLGLATNNQELANDILSMAARGRSPASGAVYFLIKNVFAKICDPTEIWEIHGSSQKEIEGEKAWRIKHSPKDGLALVPYDESLHQSFRHLYVFKSSWWHASDRSVLIYDGPWGDEKNVVSFVQRAVGARIL